MLIKVCLNGARAAGAHPALPLTPAALAEAARAAVDAGAGAVHMHPRDAQGAQSLAPDDIGAAVLAVRRACPGVPVGVSTLYAILPDKERRAAAVRSWDVRPDFASVNFAEPGTAELCAALQAIGVAVEAGLDSAEDAERYVRSTVFGACLRVLLEPGEPGVPGALARVQAMEAVLDRVSDATPRLLHGEELTAWALLDAAAERGYAARVGLEDVLLLPDGRLAPDNAALIAEAMRRLRRRPGESPDG